MEQFYQILDGILMPVFRWPGQAIFGFYLGTFVLASICVVLGDIAFGFVIWADRRRIEEVVGGVIKYNNLTMDALQTGDGGAYRACNKMANDAFGKMFFLQVAFSAASLWPLPFALAWFQYRFEGVDFPLAGTGLVFGYPGPFILIYILTRIALKPLLAQLPWFGRGPAILAEVKTRIGPMRRWSELLKPGETV